MTDTVRANGTVTSDKPCPTVGCEKADRQHWHQCYADHSLWRFGGGCPDHLHRYEATPETP